MSTQTPSPTTTPTSSQSANPTAERLAQIRSLHRSLVGSPWSDDLLELTMAVAISHKLSIAEGGSLLWLFLVGPSATGKTETVESLRNSQRTMFLDTATVASLLSGAVNDKGAQAKSLLPELDGRCLVMKDLAPLFSDDDRAVKKFLGALTGVFDGHYDRAIGTSYGPSAVVSSHSRFSLIGCVKPDTLREHDRHMAKLGGRVLMYRITGSAGPACLSDMSKRRGIRQTLAKLVEAHLADAEARLSAVTLAPDHSAALSDMAELVAKGRTPIFSEQYFVEGQRRYESVPGSTEAPHRIVEQLAILLRSLAAVNGRTVSSGRELDVVQRVALSSVLTGRAEVLEAIRSQPVSRVVRYTVNVDGQEEDLCVEWQGTTVPVCARLIGRSVDQTRNRLNDLVRLGLLVKDEGAIRDGKGQPQDFYRPTAAFEGLMLGTFGLLDKLADTPCAAFEESRASTGD